MASRFLGVYGFAGGFLCGFLAGIVLGWQLAVCLAWAAMATLYLKQRRSRVEADASRDRDTDHLSPEVEWLATRDRLTGLPNRCGLEAAFDERRNLLIERDLVISLLMIELERLRQIEEIEGPSSAEASVCGFAGILHESVGEDDRAGRLEDGRFLLILCNTRYERPAQSVARQVQEQSAAEVDLHRLGQPLSLSIGITQVSRAETSFADALTEAEQALRAAQEEGTGRIATYRSRMGSEHERRRSVLREVGAALSTGRIVPVYQPIVALDDRRIIAFEALARVQRPDGTLVGAARLRPALQDRHFSTHISERILARAIADAGRLRRTGLDFGRVAVNVTEEQIADPDCCERVLDLLIAEGLSPRDLMLEIAEQVFLSRRERLIFATLGELADTGVELAFDDFGTGYAALSNLRRFPVSTIKLEGSLIGDIAGDPEARAISAAVLAMARALDRSVVAEGVETQAVHEVLEELGCDHVQGFYYSRPVPFGGLERLARRGIAA